LSPFDLFDPVNHTWAWQQALTQPVSEPLAALLNHLLQNALNQRFQSATEVMQAMPNSARGITGLGTMPNPVYTSAIDWECEAVLSGHGGSVNAVAISSDGRWFASGSDDRSIRLWELATGKLIATLTGHSHAIKSLAFLRKDLKPSQDLLVSASQDKALRLWDASTQQCLQTFTGHTQMVTTVCEYPNLDGLMVSGSWDKTVRLWNGQTKQALCILTQHRLAVTAIATHSSKPSEQFLSWIATASCDRTAHLHSLHQDEVGYSAQRQHILADHTGAVLAVAFAPDGSIVATGSDDRTIKLWEVASGKLLQTLSGHSWSVVALAFTPDGQTLVSGSWDSTVKLWPMAGLRAIPEPITLAGHTDSVNAIAISADGQTIISASRDNTLRIWQQVSSNPLPN
ncbi:MAG TPA: WD40 repeat domain-containing protein, partial [Trichocoleus sp.]